MRPSEPRVLGPLISPFCRKMNPFFLAISVSVALFATGAYTESEVERNLYAAESRYYEAKTVIQSAFRKELSASLAMGDRVDVFLLDFEMEDTPSNLCFLEDGSRGDGSLHSTIFAM